MIAQGSNNNTEACTWVIGKISSQTLWYVQYVEIYDILLILKCTVEKLKSRKYISNEIISSERRYVKSLESIITVCKSSIITYLYKYSY